jgi:hypothetical protein
MIYVLIKNGVVQDRIEATPEFILQYVHDWDNVIQSNVAQIGWLYVGTNFTAPPAPPAPPMPVDPCANLIDIGPFFDRFGAEKMAVLTSTDSGVKAIIADVTIRKWLDLARPDVAQSLTYIGTVVTALTPALQHTILTTPVTSVENLALRKLYFS